MHQEVTLDLNGLTDLWTEFNDGNYERAKELRQRFFFDLRLLDDLGWEPDPEEDRDEFELTMDGLDLAWIVSHLIAQTGAIIHPHRRADRADTARGEVGQGTARARDDPRPTRPGHRTA